MNNTALLSKSINQTGFFLSGNPTKDGHSVSHTQHSTIKCEVFMIHISA